MKKPFRILVGACAATLVMAGGAVGADAPAPNATVTRPGPAPMERFIEPLGLTTAQQQKLRPIFAQAQAQAEADLQALKSDEQKPDEGRVMGMLKMREADFRERLAGVLTAAQLDRYNQLTADRLPREQAKEQHPAHGHRDADSAATASEK
jgi:hypothetical protein